MLRAAYLAWLTAALLAQPTAARAQQVAPGGMTLAAVDQRDVGVGDPRRDWLDKVEAARQRSGAFVERARTSGSVAGLDAPRPLTIRRRVRGLLDDPTLRVGDAVMTAQGLRLFVGAIGARHDVADFEPLDRFQGPRGRHWLELIAVEDARVDGR